MWKQIANIKDQYIFFKLFPPRKANSMVGLAFRFYILDRCKGSSSARAFKYNKVISISKNFDLIFSCNLNGLYHNVSSLRSKKYKILYLYDGKTGMAQG